MYITGRCLILMLFVIFCIYGDNENTKLGNKKGLARRDGVKIGHVDQVEFQDGRKVNVVTKALKPLLFEIPDFLTAEECDHIIKRAKDPNEGGMFQSRAKGGLTGNVTYVATGINGKAYGLLGDFDSWDNINKDGKITFEEMTSIFHATKTIYMMEKDIRELFKLINQAAILNDDVIDRDEFDKLSTLEVEKYLDNLHQNHPRFKPRTSQQAWLFMEQWLDPTVHYIRERLVKLTGLPRNVIYGGEMLQVVHYTTNGHYHAHHDSETHLRHEIPCCHQYSGDTLESTGECKICRYITFLMYLNDVEEGGETAFPMAHEDIFNPDVVRKHGNASSDKYNLSQGCKIANLLVKPKKGKAVLWYNHLRNETDGWMGELDGMSLHGGCDVIEGEKWIANMWLTAPFGKDTQTPSIFLNEIDLQLAEEKSIQQKKDKLQSSSKEEL